MKYSVINIGPITSTIMAVRRPRELWSASYIFSYLMKCIIEEIANNHNADFTIVSPSSKEHENAKVGIYPDRLFVKHNSSEASIESIIIIIDDAKNKFAKNLELDIRHINGYFNIMVASGEYEKASAAIKGLNEKADALELFQFANNTEAKQSVFNLIKNTEDSPLYDVAGFSNGRFPIETIAEIASKQLRSENEYEYDSAVKESKRNSLINEKLKKYDLELLEEDLYKKLKIAFELKSYHKYFCVVQADGDNMGKIVSHKDLDETKLKEISSALLKFGVAASEKIESYGGLPIYAGGDDLLFLAPVKGLNNQNIFDLIDSIDKECFNEVVNKANGLKDKEGREIKPSLSYGISITYYKFPLYEACSKAKSLLFDGAKKRKGKNAIEWELQKHSGSAFHGGFSKSDTILYEAFKVLLKQEQDATLVSAVSHKIRANEGLIKLWAENAEIRDERTEAFFDKFIDMNSNKEYKESVKELMIAAYPAVQKYNDGKKEKDQESLVSTLYGMIRTAKFIKGEEVEQ